MKLYMLTVVGFGGWMLYEAYSFVTSMPLFSIAF